MQNAARILLAACLVLATGARAADAPSCNHVDGAVSTTFSTAGCTSPVGLCTTGTVSSGALTGTSSFTVTELRTAGPITLFGGTYVVTNGQGTAVYATRGILDTRTGAYVETFHLVDGTGAYAGATSELVSRGYATGTGFAGDLRGELCTH